MKTSKAEFEKFKECFLKYVDLFGLKDWRIDFENRKLEDNYAEIQASPSNVESGVVGVFFDSRDSGKNGHISTEDTAKHEAIHLILVRLMYLARSRYIDSSELRVEEHRVVRILEKVIL